jgi:hypothetical protein
MRNADGVTTLGTGVIALQATTLLRRLARPAYAPATAPPRPDRRSPEEQARVRALLERAGEDGYLRRAAAAGHTMSTLERFGSRLRGHPGPELRRRLRLVDPGRPGPVRFGGVRVKQIDGTTCGPMTIVMARAVADPVYAWWLTQPAGFAGRLEAEQRRVHRGANLLWPRRFGTTPWGMATALNAGQRAVRYGWRMVDDTDPAGVGRAVEDAAASAGAGHPVPVLIGATVPRHWVLLLAAAGFDLTFYNPAPGSVVRLAAGELRAGRADPLGFPHVQAVVLPAG